jgi:2'-5' RNA ligase
MTEEEKRLFFGWEVHAPWPEKLPSGRLLDENHRHLTLAFLGKTNYPGLAQTLSDFPHPPFRMSSVGYFDRCLLLPEKHPHVAAWHICWSENKELIESYYEQLTQWLQLKGFPADRKAGFLPHVTLARSPFHPRAWRNQFSPLPVMMKDIHLYESLGHSKYNSLWSLPLLSPFEEIEHTADRAYLVRGLNFTQLYTHGAYALAFNFPPLLPFIHSPEEIDSLEKVIAELNLVVGNADREVGCPFKAVSYHIHLKTEEHHMEWEMIVDV